MTFFNGTERDCWMESSFVRCFTREMKIEIMIRCHSPSITLHSWYGRELLSLHYFRVKQKIDFRLDGILMCSATSSNWIESNCKFTPSSLERPKWHIPTGSNRALEHNCKGFANPSPTSHGDAHGVCASLPRRVRFQPEQYRKVHKQFCSAHQMHTCRDSWFTQQRSSTHFNLIWKYTSHTRA